MAGKNKLLDMTIRHSVLTQRYAATQYAVLNTFIKRLEQLSLETIPKVLGESKKRLEANLVAFREAATLSFKASKQSQMEAYKTFAQYEGQVHTQILNAATNTKANFVIPNTAQLEQAVFTNVIMFAPGNRQGKALNIGNTLSKFGVKKTAEVVGVLRQGYALGESNDAVFQRIQEVIPMQLRQASTLTRTVTNWISGQARQVVLQENEDIIEGYQWVATLDMGTCLDCFVSSTPVVSLGALENVYRGEYVGEIITITTASGKKIEGTSNHPILTPNGFLPMGEFNPGEHVVYSVSAEGMRVLGDKDVSMKPTIGELFDSFNKPASVDILSKSPSAADFYGDGAFMKNKIDIINTKGKLRGDSVASVCKRIKDVLFSGVHRLSTLFGFSFLKLLLQSRFKRPTVKGCTTNTFENFKKPFFTSMWEFCYNLVSRSPRHIHSCSFRPISHDTSVALSSLKNWHDVGSFEQVSHGSSRRSVLPSNTSSTCSGLVFEDDVVSVVREFKNCHVYSLSNSLQLYIAGGILVKNCSPRDGVIASVDEFDFPPAHYNCRCSYIPVIKQQYRDDELSNAAVRPSEGATGVEILSGKTTYSGWLRTQPASFQDEVLGVTKGKLFRSTGVGLDKFVDSNYVPYTLNQLAKKDAFHTFFE